MLGIDYHRSARKEHFDSSQYYSREQDELGQRFLSEVQTVAEDISSSPMRHPIYFEDVRRCVMLRFPFAIYYRVLPGKIRVPAISHTSRHPGYWKNRR